MNIIGQIDTSAFATFPRMHHRLDESTPEFPSSVSSRRRNLLALKAQNWREAKSGPKAPDFVESHVVSNARYPWISLYDKLSTSVGFEIVIELFGAPVRFMSSWNPDDTGFGYGMIPSNVTYIFGDITQRRMWTYASQIVGKHTISFNFHGDRKIILDGNEMAEMVEGSHSVAMENSDLLLFTNQNGFFSEGYNGYTYEAKLYGVKVTDGAELVRDCIPAIGEDGSGQIYDKITKTFMLNRSTQPLTYGWD